MNTTETRKLKTIKLKGKDYVEVKERVSFFNEEYPNGSIQSEMIFGNKGVIFKAIITPDVSVPTRQFFGHSHSENLTGDKAMEKLETVAIGRALAFMGIGIIDSVASADEMQKFTANSNIKLPSKSAKEKKEEMKLQDGDKLVKGVSKSTNKPWFAIQRGEAKIWLTEDQFDFLSDIYNQSQNEKTS